MKLASKSFSRGRERSGSILILVLACCAVAVAMIMISVKVSLQQRQKLKSELQLEQARWVLDAAIRKSIAEPDIGSDKVELKPKLDKFDKVTFSATTDGDDKKVFVQARIEDDAGRNVTSRSANFEQSD